MKRNKLKNDERYFWIPTKMWRVKDEKLFIGENVYDETVAHLFPQLYFLLQEGRSPSEIVSYFPSELKIIVFGALRDFLENDIIASKMGSASIVFEGYEMFMNSHLDEDTFFNPELYEKYKKKQLGRCYYRDAETVVQLSKVKYENFIENRKSCREFEDNKLISFEKISKILSIYRQKNETEEITYYYAADGGLYPIDVYIYIKENRVENISQGLYYFNPINNELTLVSKSCIISENLHFQGNKEIYNTSAMSIFYIYNAEVTMPKYGGTALQYAAIDVGLMVELLTIVAEQQGIGICSIGSIKFEKIEKYFRLSSNCILLHTVELGLIKESVNVYDK